MRSKAAWAPLLLVASVGCTAGAPSDLTASTSESIAGGTLDTSDSAVFQEITHYSDAVTLCTSSLIAPNVLLTARHCISQAANGENPVVCGRTPFGAPVGGSQVIATNAVQPSRNSTYYHGAEVRVPDTGDDICGFDVALIILDSVVPATQATPLVPRIDRPVAVGESYRAVGYGLDASGDANPGRMQLGNLAVSCRPGECPREPVAATEFVGDTGVCSGDSGGPALDTDGKVIGVVSRGSDPCATPVYGQVASWSEFITSTVLDAAAKGGYRAPFWAYSGSSDEDASLAPVGAPCSDTSECEPGSVCYYTGDPSDAVCTYVCANGAQCTGDAKCQQGFDVPGGGLCLSPAAPAGSDGTPAPRAATARASSSCTLSPGGGSVAAAWLFAALLAGGSVRRRSRKSRF